MTGLITTKALILNTVLSSWNDEVNPKMVSRKIDMVYSHTTTLISELEDDGMITTKKTGRKKVLKLTPTGRKFAEAVNDMVTTAEEEVGSKKILNEKVYE